MDGSDPVNNYIDIVCWALEAVMLNCSRDSGYARFLFSTALAELLSREQRRTPRPERSGSWLT